MSEDKREAAKTLFNQLFDIPRDPRSDEYKRGVWSAIAFRFLATPVVDPYEPIAAQSDAFYSGLSEGHAEAIAVLNEWEKCTSS
ncbi:MAG TPA: hypothetical protein V6C86_05760 [Oculatellaceae cyanobacterium]